MSNVVPHPSLSAWDGEGAVTSAALKLRVASFPDPLIIPPRQWLHGVDLVLGFVSVLVAPGGVGKTTLGLTRGLAVASGRELLGVRVWVSGNVLFCGLEDPDEETERRMAAILLHHGLDRETLDGRVFKITPDDQDLVIAELSRDGMTIAYPHRDALVALARENEIKLIVVDPFVNCHGLEENSNPHMNAVVRAWRQVAREAMCSIDLVHHTRKGAEAGDPEGARGAKAVIDAARVASTMTTMTSDEAKTWGISDTARRFHVRLDDAKRNMAPPDRARWFQLVGVDLGNGTPLYPNGDNVQVIVPWDPPTIFGDATGAALNDILDLIAEGLDGTPYAPDRRGRNNRRWVGGVLVDRLGMTEDQALRAVAAWVRNGVLVVGKVMGADHKDIGAVLVGKRPTQ